MWGWETSCGGLGPLPCSPSPSPFHKVQGGVTSNVVLVSKRLPPRTPHCHSNVTIFKWFSIVILHNSAHSFFTLSNQSQKQILKPGSPTGIQSFKVAITKVSFKEPLHIHIHVAPGWPRQGWEHAVGIYWAHRTSSRGGASSRRSLPSHLHDTLGSESGRMEEITQSRQRARWALKAVGNFKHDFFWRLDVSTAHTHRCARVCASTHTH